MALNKIEDIIDDIRQGKMVILMDDEDRENEGDLIMAASCVRPEDVNFMTRFGRGLVCLTLTEARCKQLGLSLMVSHHHYSLQRTNFTVSIEAREGVTTGISAADRAVTIQTAVTAEARPDDLIQPGHIFPIMARPGGVLSRAGHTEAGCDLARLAGFEPAAAIVEILNEDGTMARRPQLEKLAKKHGLKIGTIADLIQYRTMHEETVKRVDTRDVETPFGTFQLVSYLDAIDDQMHLALVKGEINAETPTPVRVHYPDTLNDLLHVKQAGAPVWRLHDAMQHIADAQNGVVVVLAQQPSSSQLLQRIQASQQPATTASKTLPPDLRTIGAGSRILADLGVRKMRVLSAPKKIHALSGFGLEVVDYIAPPAHATAETPQEAAVQAVEEFLA